MAGNDLFFVYSRRMENERMDIEGFKRLYEERLEALETLIRTGEAASITEAVSRYKAKNIKPAE